MTTDGPTDDADAVGDPALDAATSDSTPNDTAPSEGEAGAAATDQDAEPVASAGYPPLQVAPGTVFTALLGVVVMTGQVLFARTVPQLIYALVAMPILFVGAIARWRVPVWRTRLPVGVQAVLSAGLLLVSIPLVAIDEGFSSLAVLWIFSFALFPDLLPDRLRRWLETSVR